MREGLKFSGAVFTQHNDVTWGRLWDNFHNKTLQISTTRWRIFYDSSWWFFLVFLFLFFIIFLEALCDVSWCVNAEGTACPALITIYTHLNKFRKQRDFSSHFYRSTRCEILREFPWKNFEKKKNSAFDVVSKIGIKDVRQMDSTNKSHKNCCFWRFLAKFSFFKC
jgi:hypothetical protein